MFAPLAGANGPSSSPRISRATAAVRAAYGLTKAKLEPYFERYLSQYDIEREG